MSNTLLHEFQCHLIHSRELLRELRAHGRRSDGDRLRQSREAIASSLALLRRLNESVWTTREIDLPARPKV